VADGWPRTPGLLRARKSNLARGPGCQRNGHGGSARDILVGRLCAGNGDVGRKGKNWPKWSFYSFSFSSFLFLSLLYFFDFRFKSKFGTKFKYTDLNTIVDEILSIKFILCYIIFISHFIYIVLNSLNYTFGSNSNFPLIVILLLLLFYYQVHKQAKLHHDAQSNKTQHDAHINLSVTS
jgi:hypothetical protein